MHEKNVDGGKNSLHQNLKNGLYMKYLRNAQVGAV